MNATTTHHDAGAGVLMNCLLKERSRFVGEAEFIAFALAEVRRFMLDLHAINIDIAVRSSGSDAPQVYSPKE